MSLKHGVELDTGYFTRCKSGRTISELSHKVSIRLVEVAFGDISGVEIDQVSVSYFRNIVRRIDVYRRTLVDLVFPVGQWPWTM